MSGPDREQRLRVVILTGSELRHTYFRKWIASSPGIAVRQTYCEGVEKSLGNLVQAQPENTLRLLHLRAREESERVFFQEFVDRAEDRSNAIFLPKGEINGAPHVAAISGAAPDLLVCYGASIIREPLLSAFAGRFLNVHLGLSPYYRGSGTNYWPLVNGEPEYVGATFMHIDAGIDTGEVIHQIRARVEPGDTPAAIGNRLICDMARVCSRIVKQWDRLEKVRQIPPSPRDRIYKKKDYTEASVAKLYERFRNGLVDDYLKQAEERCSAVPLMLNPAIDA